MCSSESCWRAANSPHWDFRAQPQKLEIPQVLHLDVGKIFAQPHSRSSRPIQQPVVKPSRAEKSRSPSESPASLGAEGEQPGVGLGLICKAIVLPCTAGFSSHNVHTAYVAVYYTIPLPKCIFVAFMCPKSLFLALTFPSPEKSLFLSLCMRTKKTTRLN